MKYMDEAITELDNMDGLISTYKIHLNVWYPYFSYYSNKLTIVSGCQR